MVNRILFVVLIGICLLPVRSNGQSQLSAHVESSQSGTLFQYRLVNDGSPGDGQFINSFMLLVSAPITVTQTPAGWEFETDGIGYVSWYSVDSALPYVHDLQPGASLDGFAISSIVDTAEMQPYSITSWDHPGDAPGLDLSGAIVAPSAPYIEAPERTFLPLIRKL
jgi:hypothetical protein